jgi:hypothetical protein
MKIEKSILHHEDNITYLLTEHYSEVDANNDIPKLKEACVIFVGGESFDETIIGAGVEIDNEHPTIKTAVFKGAKGTAQLTVWEDESKKAEILAFGRGDKRSLGLTEE